MLGSDDRKTFIMHVKSQIMLCRIPCLFKRIFRRDLQDSQTSRGGGGGVCAESNLSGLDSNASFCKEVFFPLQCFYLLLHIYVFFYPWLQKRKQPKSKLRRLDGVKVCLGFRGANFSLFYSCRLKWQQEFLRRAARFDSECCHKCRCELTRWQAQIGSTLSWWCCSVCQPSRWSWQTAIHSPNTPAHTMELPVPRVCKTCKMCWKTQR